MIEGTYWKLLRDEAAARIDGAAMRLLTRQGARIPHVGLLRRLEAAGCRVDFQDARCRFPERLVRDAVHRLGSHAADRVEIPPGWNGRWRMGLSGSYPHLLEWPSGERRLARREDVIRMAKLAQTLDEFSAVGRVLCPSDVDPRLEPLWTTLQLAEWTDKPIAGGEVLSVECLEPLVRMAEVITGRPRDTSLIASCDFWVAPLHLDPLQAELFLAKRNLGLAICPGTMPISGLSAPVTVAGAVTVAMAELLAGWTLGYVLDPTLPATGIVASGSLDMRTTQACFGSPEAVLQNVAVAHGCRRLYGIEVSAGCGYTDAKRPGLEATFWKMLPLLGAPFGISRTLVSHGLLSAGQDYCVVQHVLDYEMFQAIERFWGHFDVNDETLALELTESVLQSGSADFLASDHALRHGRAETWYPRWLDRSPWQGSEVERTAELRMLERIDRYCREAIQRYEKPARERAAMTELRRIVQAAEASMLGRNAAPGAG